ncbi:MAG TPA: trypsin-like peptidase domain-containing protein [Dehalococcoidia bacterium]|nr:trypsin-like peptidase domain-containing protein [Dehalococcoidia bacterium]
MKSQAYDGPTSYSAASIERCARRSISEMTVPALSGPRAQVTAGTLGQQTALCIVDTGGRYATGAPTARTMHEHAPPPPPPETHGWPHAEHPLPPPPETRPVRRTVAVRTVVLIAVLALIAGGGAAYGIARAQSSSSSITIGYDTTPLSSTTQSVAAVARSLAPAVGTVIATLSSTSSSIGSGFVIAHSGRVSYLVTNNHVVTGSSNVHVLMPTGASFAATVVGADRLDDLAVLSVASTSLPVVTFGDSAQLQVGQPVVAIGSPLGDQGSVTAGVISALHRTISPSNESGTQTETLEDVLQTDAPINPGNSGGPLADLGGRVVGVNVATAGSGTSIGFSIPANLARQVAGDLIAHRQVQHPFLGIAYLDAIQAIEQGRGFSGPGVLVTQVSPGTPAAQAGFQPGDILQSIDGVAIDNGETLGGLLQTKRDGEQISCTVLRSGKTVTLTPTLEERPGGA